MEPVGKIEEKGISKKQLNLKETTLRKRGKKHYISLLNKK